MREWIKKNKLNLITMLIFAAISLILVLFHENGRDEAQSWLLAKNLSFTELFAQLKYEGHFMLWYLILMPFAKLGFPYITSNIISWIITCITVWIILLKSPFKTYQKNLFIFSFPMLYLYPVIPRCYCLIPLAITLIALFYKDRKEKPIRYCLSIILLANTHVLMLSMVAVLLIKFYFECLKNRKLTSHKQNYRFLISFILTIILLLISFLPIFKSLLTNKEIGSASSLIEYIALILIEIILLIFSIIPLIANYKKSNPYLIYIISIICFMIQLFYIIEKSFTILINNIFILIIIYVFIAILLFFCFKNFKKYSIEFILIIFYQFMIYTLIYGTSYQKCGSIIFVIMFYLWIYHYDNNKNIPTKDSKILNCLFTAIMILNIFGGTIFEVYEIFYNFSSAYEVRRIYK